MKSVEKLILGLFGIAALVVGGFFLVGNNREPRSEELGATGPITEPGPTRTTGPAESPSDRPVTRPNQDGPGRRQVEPGDAAQDLPQGFVGLVVDNMGTPVQSARLTLVHGFQLANLGEILRAAQKKGGLL